jgi:hypothetical protein
MDIEPGPGTSAFNFAVFPERRMLTASVHWPDSGNMHFGLRCRALQTGLLSDLFKISGSITRAEAYMPWDKGGDHLDIALRFRQKGLAFDLLPGVELFQNQPNPFQNGTRITFYLPEDGEADIAVYDEAGATCFYQEGRFTKGLNTVAIEGTEIKAGVLWCRLSTAAGSATCRMIKIP